MDLAKKAAYYASIEAELRAIRSKIVSLAKNPKILGDYYEEIFRDFLKSQISERYGIFHGRIYHDDTLYDEYDVIIIDTFEYHPIFRAGELLITDPESIRVVIQVKGTLTKSGLIQAYKNLESARKLNEGILCFIFCFENRAKKEDIIDMVSNHDSPIHGLYILDGSKYFSRAKIIHDDGEIKFPEDFPALGHMLELMKASTLKSLLKSNFRISSRK